VLLHQTALSSRSYLALLQRPDLDMRLIAPDLPGFGQSFRPEGWPSIAQFARWISAARCIMQGADAIPVGRLVGTTKTRACGHAPWRLAT
jgi:pimeloyl-ACP methyl ester carboxylesterase